MADETVSGPVDYLLLEFHPDADTGPAAAALRDLVDRDVVRVYDLVIVRKEQDGTASVLDLAEATTSGAGGFRALQGARSGLLGEDDVREVVEVMEPGTAGALVVYENTWARDFVRAALEAGAEVVAGGRISPATFARRSTRSSTPPEPHVEATDDDTRPDPPTREARPWRDFSAGSPAPPQSPELRAPSPDGCSVARLRSSRSATRLSRLRAPRPISTSRHHHRRPPPSRLRRPSVSRRTGSCTAAAPGPVRRVDRRRTAQGAGRPAGSGRPHRRGVGPAEGPHPQRLTSAGPEPGSAAELEEERSVVSFLETVWVIVISFAFIAYLIVLFTIVVDLVRDPELSGLLKALWILALIVLPFLSAVVYLVVRGRGMADRESAAVSRAAARQEAYIRSVAGTNTSATDQIDRAHQLLGAGVISPAEFEALKAKALT